MHYKIFYVHVAFVQQKSYNAKFKINWVRGIVQYVFINVQLKINFHTHTHKIKYFRMSWKLKLPMQNNMILESATHDFYVTIATDINLFMHQDIRSKVCYLFG